MDKTIRWKQRFANYERAFLRLATAVQIKNPSDTERAGMIQFFELAFELAWKTLKDYLESEGFVVKSPRETLKQAYQNGYIEKGHAWMESLEDRNLTAHNYDEITSKKIEKLIREKYFSILQDFFNAFQSKK